MLKMRPVTLLDLLSAWRLWKCAGRQPVPHGLLEELPQKLFQSWTNCLRVSWTQLVGDRLTNEAAHFHPPPLRCFRLARCVMIRSFMLILLFGAVSSTRLHSEGAAREDLKEIGAACNKTEDCLGFETYGRKIVCSKPSFRKVPLRCCIPRRFEMLPASVKKNQARKSLEGASAGGCCNQKIQDSTKLCL
eukprot:s1614_g16.t1